MTEWKSQSGDGKYAIQFETQDYKLYKMVEKVCQKAVDEADKKRQKGRAQEMAAVGHPADIATVDGKATTAPNVVQRWTEVQNDL